MGGKNIKVTRTVRLSVRKAKTVSFVANMFVSFLTVSLATSVFARSAVALDLDVKSEGE